MIVSAYLKLENMKFYVISRKKTQKLHTPPVSVVIIIYLIPQYIPTRSFYNRFLWLAFLLFSFYFTKSYYY